MVNSLTNNQESRYNRRTVNTTTMRPDIAARGYPCAPSRSDVVVGLWSTSGGRAHHAVDRMVALRREAIYYSLRSAETFENLPEQDLRDLAEAAVLKTLDKGSYLFREGEPVAGLYLVRRGIINLHHVAMDGREVVIHFYREGETLAEASAVADSGCPGDARAVVSSEIILIPRQVLAAKLRQCPDLGLCLLGSLDRQFRKLAGAFEDVTSKNAGARFVQWLLRQCEDADGTEPTKVKLNTTKRVLASELGVRQETLSRTLRQLSDAGHLAVNGRRITIKNPSALRNACTDKAFCLAD